MKKFILIITALTFIVDSCGSNNKEASDQEKEAGNKDSISVELEQSKKEIEESAEKLDTLVNDL